SVTSCWTQWSRRSSSARTPAMPTSAPIANDKIADADVLPRRPITVSDIDNPRGTPPRIWTSRQARVAILALAGILAHLTLRYLTTSAGSRPATLPLVFVLLLGGIPLVLRLAWRGLHGEFG